MDKKKPVKKEKAPKASFDSRTSEFKKGDFSPPKLAQIKEENKESEEERKQKWLIVVSLLACLVVVVALAIIAFSWKEKKGALFTTPKESDYEQIKKSIVTGELDKVPEGINKTKEEIIQEYLDNCHTMDTEKMIVDCIELYYVNDADRQTKKICNSLNEEKKTGCMDKYYVTKFRDSLDNSYCSVIQDVTQKNICSSY